jgi:hypothetical protein
MEIQLTVKRSEVLHRVARMTNYTGAKREGDENAYDRISTVDEDDDELKLFWDEMRGELVNILAGKIVSEGLRDNNDTYDLVLSVYDGFNTALIAGMTINLFYYFVYGILAKWYIYTNEQSVDDYAAMSAVQIDELSSYLVQRVFERDMFFKC